MAVCIGVLSETQCVMLAVVVLTGYFGDDEVTSSVQDVDEADVGVADLDTVFVIIVSSRLTHQCEPQTTHMPHNHCDHT